MEGTLYVLNNTYWDFTIYCFLKVGKPCYVVP